MAAVAETTKEVGKGECGSGPKLLNRLKILSATIKKTPQPTPIIIGNPKRCLFVIFLSQISVKPNFRESKRPRKPKAPQITNTPKADTSAITGFGAGNWLVDTGKMFGKGRKTQRAVNNA